MSEWRKARKKPVVIEFREVKPIFDYEGFQGELVHTREGNLVAHVGRDYVIRGVEGELYPITKTIFDKTYEVLDE